jgi:hypothetical protein
MTWLDEGNDPEEEGHSDSFHEKVQNLLRTAPRLWAS